MTLVTGVTLPNDGDRIKAVNYNSPIQKILASLNGNLDDTNITSLSGSKISSGSLPVASLAESVAAGWFPSSDPLTYVSNNGSKEYTVTTPGDKTTKYSAGMRMKISRAGTTPTTCADIESSSSQYASKVSPSGIVFTDDFTVEAWVKLESYVTCGILSRRNAANGWEVYLNNTGQVGIAGINGSATDIGLSYQSLPLNQWVHVAATLDMSASTSTIYINGVSVPVAYTNGAPTSLVQATVDLALGATNGSNYFDGKMAEVRLWPSVRTQAQIRDNMNIQLTGTEGMVGLWQLDETSGTTFNDSTLNANHLTAAGGLTAGTADNPFNTTEYGIITKVAYSSPNTTITVFTGTDYNLPNGALSNFYYSALGSPHGFPAADTKWRLSTILRTVSTTTSNATYGSFISGGYRLTVPTGEWNIGHKAGTVFNSTTNVWFNISPTSLAGLNEAQAGAVSPFGVRIASGGGTVVTSYFFEHPQSLTTQQTYVMYTFGSTTSAGLSGDATLTEIFAECAYI